LVGKEDSLKHFSWLSFKRYWKSGIWELFRNPTSKFQWERFTQYTIDMVFQGFTSADTWSVDCYIVEFAIPRLEMFREYMPCGHPGNLNSDEWIKIVDKIIKGLKLYYKDHCDGKILTEQEKQEVEEGMQLFFNYFSNLWN